VNIVFDNCFMIEGIRIVKGPTELFVSFPAKKQRDGTHRDVAFPANAETRVMIQRVILAEYEKIVAESDPKSQGKIINNGRLLSPNLPPVWRPLFIVLSELSLKAVFCGCRCLTRPFNFDRDIARG
jgi:DNA-binding cell septation regulator SpoVG